MATEAAEVNPATLRETPLDSYEVGREYPGMAGLRFRREEDESFTCAACGKGAYENPVAVQGHWNLRCQENPKRAAADHKLEQSRLDPVAGPIVRSRRGKRRLGVDRAPTVLEEIRDRPGGMLGGPAAYFINPEGATIREALIINPNGAPVVKNGTDRANARYYQDRARDKGHEYIGPNLTIEGVRRLVEVINSNRYDYLLDIKEQMQDCEQTILESDRPDVRDNARKRRGQLERLVEIASRDIDPEAVVAELNDVLKAMKLAALSPSQREAITIMMGEQVDTKIQSLIARMERKGVRGDFADGGFSATTRNAAPGDDF